MKTYYQDSYLTSLTSEVKEIRKENNDWLVALSQTVFYPGGGGQLPDRGTLDKCSVEDVFEEEGKVYHKLSNCDSLRVGRLVELHLDWQWRYYNMQQHSGQHLLSRVLDEYGLKTVSVHLGSEYTMIEVEGPVPETKLLNKIENRANQHIRENRQISSFFVSQKEVDRYPLRKPAGDWDELRIVEIDKYDFSACGGTHVKNCSEIGYIKIIGTEKIRGHLRIKSVIGQRAEVYFSELHRSAARLKELLSCDIEQFAVKIENLIDENRKFQKQYSASQIQLAANIARHISEQHSSQPIVVHECDDVELNLISEVAKSLSSQFERVSFLFKGNRFFLSAPVDATIDTSRFLAEQSERFGIKGGGPKGFVQGIAEKMMPEDILKALRSYI